MKNAIINNILPLSIAIVCLFASKSNATNLPQNEHTPDDSCSKIYPTACVVDTITLSNPTILLEQYRGFVFPCKPDNLTRENIAEVLNHTDWYVWGELFWGFYLDHDAIEKYKHLLYYVLDPWNIEISTKFIKEEKWWIGHFDNPNQKFLVVLMNVDVLNSHRMETDYVNEEHFYEESPKNYPSLNPKISYLRMLVPVVDNIEL